MAMEVDHYAVLGLPTCEESCKLSQKEITKAYHSKALELHPDKKRNDPNAHQDFQRLQNSYDILKDEKSRKLYDEKMIKQYKHKKMTAEREKQEKRARDREEEIFKNLKAEVPRFRPKYTPYSKSQFGLEKKKFMQQQHSVVFRSAGFSSFYCGSEVYDDSMLAKLRKAGLKKFSGL